MKIQEIMDKLFAWSPLQGCERTCDLPVTGDMEREVHKVGVCIIATPEVLRKAKALGVDAIINHEGTYHHWVGQYADAQDAFADRVNAAKAKLVAQTDIPIYRFHDHPHFTQIDKINKGFVFKLGLAGSFDGKRLFTLDTPMTIDALEAAMRDTLKLEHIRFIGQRDKKVKTFSLCLGAWGEKTLYEQLNRADADAVLCGEICEYSVCEYVRDAAQLGIDMALFVLGHMGSERYGMEYIAEHINETMDGVTAVYLESDEVYN